MDLMEMAQELQTMLIHHDKAVKHILSLDSKVCDMNQRTLNLVNSGKTSQALQMMLRKTTMEGMREMYREYRSRKWEQIQKLSKKIMSQLSPDSPQILPENPFSEEDFTSDVDERVEHVIKVAMVQQCEFARNTN